MINFIDTAIGAAGGLVTALGGVAGIRFLTTRHSEKRKAAAEAYGIELETLRKQYDWLQQKCDALNKRIDELYRNLHALEMDNLELKRKNAELELALKMAQYTQGGTPVLPDTATTTNDNRQQ